MSSSALGSQSIALLTLPAGTLVDYAGTVEPSGWLLCDGRAVSRSAFASLFAAIGTSYGTGDGSTTFNIPDFRGRFARYNDNMGTAAGAAGRDTFARNADKSQGQATAKNGLTNSNSEVRAAGSPSGGTVSYFTSAGNNGSGTSATGSMGTAIAQTITGDAETRPINLSCNKLIKI